MEGIAELVRQDDDAPGSPKKDTINRCLAGTELPQQADVVSLALVLAKLARWDAQHCAEKARNLWYDARFLRYAGEPIRDFTDPFALQVHEVIESEFAVPAELPVYVEREHDRDLRRRVAAAVAGHSVQALLLGESSTGKTRACWEAVQAVPDHWRLWHPRDADEALEGLPRLAPETVVWLDEAHTFFLTPGSPTGDRLAQELKKVLETPGRAPVLLLGTIWPEHLSTVRAISGNANRLFDARVRFKPDGRRGPMSADLSMPVVLDVVINVPADFNAPEVQRQIKEAAAADHRWAEARQKAEDGRLTQYLAGGPQVERRYRDAPQAARALIQAAMDVRRLGHGPLLPRPLLEAALPGYMDQASFDMLTNERLEQAWTYVSDPEPCRGARPPLGEVRAGSTTTAESGAQPHVSRYRLSDFLDHGGRFERIDQEVPTALWEASAAYAEPAALLPLADAARSAGSYLHAYRLYAKAVEQGTGYALLQIRDLPGRLQWADDALPWLRGRAEAGDLVAQRVALHVMRSMGRLDEAEDWIWSRAESGAADALREGVSLLEASEGSQRGLERLRTLARQGDLSALTETGDLLQAQGRFAEACALYEQAADHGDAIAVRKLVSGLLDAGRTDDALDWLRYRSDEGDVDALGVRVDVMRSLGLIGEMLEWLRKRMVAGDFSALREAVDYFDESGLEEMKLDWYQEAAAAGHTVALLHVADQLAARGRISEALDWYRHTAVSTNNRIAMHKAGRILQERGEVEEAVSWLSRAAVRRDRRQPPKDG
jgi:tetratricopeptide (TPR) repeat protein